MARSGWRFGRMTADAIRDVVMILAAVACLGQLTFLSPPPAGACSMIANPPVGALAADGSVVFTFQEPDDAHPGRLRLVHTSATGVPTGELRVDLGVVDASFDAHAIDRAGNIWLAIHCYFHPEGELCNRLAMLTPNGEIAHTLPLAVGVQPHFDPARERFLESRIDNPRRLSIIASAASRDAPLVQLTLPHDLELDPSSRPAWAIGRDGEAALAIAIGEEIRFLRYDASGRLTSRTSFPAARSVDYFDDSALDNSATGGSKTARLGPIGQMVLAEDGTLYASQYAYGADCSVYQPPSVAILDSELNLVAVAASDGRIHRIQAVADELVVLQENSSVIRFTSDGTRIESWTPELEWRRRPEENRAPCERVKTIDRAAGVAAWLAVHPCAHGEKETQIEGWLIEAGLDALDEAPDRLWRDLGPGLCARYPRLAPREALRRFARSYGVNQAQWLETLAACFPEPPPEAYSYAVDMVGREGHYYEQAVQIAFKAWGHPSAILDTLWRQALGPTSQPEAGQELLRNFHNLAEDFDDRLEHGPQSERRIVRQLLFETMRRSSWYLYFDHSPDSAESAPASDNRSRLLEMAAIWAQRADPFTATTGEFLLVGHGGRSAAALPALLDATRQDPELTLWLIVALEHVVNDRDAFAALPPKAQDTLVSLALAAPTTTRAPLRSQGGSFLDDPYDWLFEVGGDVILERLYATAVQPDAAIKLRQRLLGRLYEQPWALDSAALEHLLEQPWLGHWKHLRRTLGFAARLNQILEGFDGPLRKTLHRRTRQLFLSAAERRPLHSPLNRWDDKDRLLRQSLSTRDVAALVDQTPDGLRQWLWLIAITGTWPAIESEVEALLSDSTLAVTAAVALAPRHHPAALGVLKRLGLRWDQAPASAFAGYGEGVRKWLEPLIFDDDHMVRRAARRVLPAIQPGPETLAKLAAEATQALAKGELPEFEIALALLDCGLDCGLDLMPQLVAQLEIQRCAGHYLSEYEESLEFARAVARWSRADPDRQSSTRDLQQQLNDLASPAALAWLAGVVGEEGEAARHRVDEAGEDGRQQDQHTDPDL